ncbi:MAG: FHA domain-containing protein, partial [Victivallales bacterium]|nr:FHA domain-containing protein [Victivallales bacterium]
MPTFTMQSGYDKSKEIEIAEGVTMIGREIDCAIVITTSNASRHHLKVTNKNDKVVVEDLGSSNGTFVNSTPITKPYTLKHQDVIQIGENIFVFHDIEKPSEPSFAGPVDGQSTSEYYTFSFMNIVIKKLEANLKKVIKGKPDAIRDIITALFADGHILIEDMPGVG